jgi:hypothetical protein
MFAFRCGTCHAVHEGIPSFGWDYPVQYLAVPESQRGQRCVLTPDTCAIDDEHYFVRGCLDVPLIGRDDILSWGVWTSLSMKNFVRFQELLAERERAAHEPFFGWLCSHVWIYPETLNLKTRVHLRDNGLRPYIELEPTEHPLAVEQRDGITVERVAEIYEKMLHGPAPGG